MKSSRSSQFGRLAFVLVFSIFFFFFSPAPDIQDLTVVTMLQGTSHTSKHASYHLCRQAPGPPSNCEFSIDFHRKNQPGSQRNTRSTTTKKKMYTLDVEGKKHYIYMLCLKLNFPLCILCCHLDEFLNMSSHDMATQKIIKHRSTAAYNCHLSTPSLFFSGFCLHQGLKA